MEWQPKTGVEKGIDWEKILAAANLKEAMSSLPPRQRAVINMRFFKGMTQTEIARCLSVSQMHISRLQHQGLRALKRFFEGETVGKR
jgi:RNA polymerase sigma factor (sigma-70 family)